MEPLSPELALVDPELARRARELLPVPSLELTAAERRLELPRQLPDTAPVGPPRRARHGFLTRVAAVLVVPSILLNIALINRQPSDAPRLSSAPSHSVATGKATRSDPQKPRSQARRSGVESAAHAENARPARVVAETATLEWPAVPNSTAYDVVVWRGHRRIADVWTAKPALPVPTLACSGRLLPAGRYLWFVYPAHRRLRDYRFGRLVKWGVVQVGAATCRGAEGRSRRNPG